MSSDGSKPRDPVRVAKEETLGKRPSISHAITLPSATAIALSASAASGSSGFLTRSKLKPTIARRRPVLALSVDPPHKMSICCHYLPLPNCPRLLRYHARLLIQESLTSLLELLRTSQRAAQRTLDDLFKLFQPTRLPNISYTIRACPPWSTRWTPCMPPLPVDGICLHGSCAPSCGGVYPACRGLAY